MERIESVFENIEELKKDYFIKNNKNIFYKNAQKEEINKMISEQYIEELLQKTVFIIHDTSHIFFDYEIFKLYACVENYEKIVLFFLKTVDECIQKNGEYYFHISLKTFTISAAERHANFLQLINLYCTSTEYNSYIRCLNIYNVPSVIEIIYKILYRFIDPHLRNMINYFEKDVSGPMIENLLTKGQSINYEDAQKLGAHIAPKIL